MKKIYLYIIALLMGITSCSEDILMEKTDSKDEPSNNMVEVTKDGYLDFKTQSAFENYISLLRDEESSPVTRNSYTPKLIGFTSLNDLQKTLETVSNRSVDSNDEDCEENCEEDCEEGSEDEYHLSVAQDLIKDDVLTNVLDTTLRISIADRFYKIAEQGTFYCDKKDAEGMAEIISKFDKNSATPVADNIYQINDKFYFYDTFGLISGNAPSEDLEPVVVEEETEAETRSILFGDASYNSSVYGLNTYKWKNKTVLGKVTSWLFGKDVSREHNFDSKHRIKCELFQVNYVFYASTGFKVKMQKRKKIWFVKYWVSTGAQDMVIGIERLSGKMSFNYNPGQIVNYGTFTHSWQGIVNNMIYAGLQRPTFVEDWTTDNITTIFPGVKDFNFLKWKIEPWAWTNNLTKDAIYFGLNSLTGKIANAVGKKLQKEDPRIAMVMSRRGELETHIMGIRAFGARSSKTVRFSQAAGISITISGKTIGYIPEKFSITQAEVFGAVKYNGKWKGIRFTHKL